VVVMYCGQVVETAPVQTLLTAPAHPYTRALMQAVPVLHQRRESRLYNIPGAVPENFDHMTGCRFAPRCPYAVNCPQTAEGVSLTDNHWVRCCRPLTEGGDAHGA